jgi:hypothetical protein
MAADRRADSRCPRKEARMLIDKRLANHWPTVHYVRSISGLPRDRWSMAHTALVMYNFLKNQELEAF